MTLESHTPKSIYRRDYQPPAFLVDTVALDIALDPARTRVSNRMTIRPNPAAAGKAPLRLDGEAQTLIAVRIDGRELSAADYTLDSVSLTLEPPGSGPFTVEIVSETVPAENTALEGLYLSGETLTTQCEAEGFRRITYFIDRPDVLSVYRTRLTADEARFPVLLSNGNRITNERLGDGRHLAEWHDPFPKPCYLFAVVAGRLACLEDSFTTQSGRRVGLHLYVEPGNEPRATYALDALKRAMAWDETEYGLEYDLDVFQIVAVSDFNMGAMENKGLNVFNAKFILADPHTATDQDYANIEAVVAHEYFHNWTGNRVTCRDWFQLSLKEGLTVFRDQQFSASQRSAPVERINDVRNLRAMQFIEDAGPLAHPVRPDRYVEINNFYTATVYEKGAEVIRMMHTLLGRDAFRRGMDLYFRRHDGTAATCEDFVAAMEDASGRDLTQFRLWYAQAGTPELSLDSQYDAVAKRFRLTVTQHTPPTPGQPDKAPLHIPLKLGLIGADGQAMACRLDGEPVAEAALDRVFDLTRETQVFDFVDVASAPVVSVLRGFSAPCRNRTPGREADRQLLVAHDADPFNRWDAAQRSTTELILAHARGDKTAFQHSTLFEALERALNDPALDDAFKALLLALPPARETAQQMNPVDVDGLHAAREAMETETGRRLEPTLSAIHHGARINAPYAPTAEQAGKRALRNAALRLLSKAGQDAALAIIESQAKDAANMTDQMAALAVLADTDSAARVPAFDGFYQRWRKNPLVVDKWLMLQATSNRADTLATVRSLMNHEAFSIKNPNKVRALFGSFAHGNFLCFHSADGAGYDLVADVVLALDRLNPQVAARLITAFDSWRRFDAGRQAKARAALERIAAAELSPNVGEMTERMLG